MPHTLEAGVNRLDYTPTEGTYLPNENDIRIFGLDISEFNGEWDFAATSLYNESWPVPVEFFVIRSGQSWGSDWQDKLFVRNMLEAKEHGFPRMAYHVLFPGQPPERQAQQLVDNLNLVGGPPEGGVALDVELVHNQSPMAISNASKEFLDEYTRLVGIDSVKFCVYSGKWFVDQYMQKQPWMYEVFWWIARWEWPKQSGERDHLSRDDMPFDFPLRISLIHQTGSYGDGILMGCPPNNYLKRVDTNRWMGDRVLFEMWFEIENSGPTELEERVELLETQVVALYDKIDSIKEIL